MLGLRAHSAAELVRKLGRRGHEAEEIEAAVLRLREQNYLNDAEFAQATVRHRSANRGAAAIRAELQLKGVARPLVDAAVAALDPETQMAGAERLARQWLHRAETQSLKSLLDVAGPRLVRRGYSPGVAREACRRALAG